MLVPGAPAALSMTYVEALLVRSDSDCPSAEVVQAEVRELTTAEQRRGVLPGSRAVIRDRGESIAIALTRDGKTTVRVYHDAARDCARRGHFVSVLVVVSLMPPELGSDPEPAPGSSAGGTEPSSPLPQGESGESDAGSDASRSAPVEEEPGDEPESTKASHASERTPWGVGIELGARAEASTSISDSVRVAGFGGALGLALGTGPVRFTLGAGYLPKDELRYTGRYAGRAELERLDVALGARLALGRAPVDTSFDAGLVVSRAVVTGLDTLRPERATALMAGLRAGLRACWSERSLVSPFLGAHVQVFPFAPALSQLPQGTVGHLPYIWVGVSGGLQLAL